MDMPFRKVLLFLVLFLLGGFLFLTYLISSNAINIQNFYAPVFNKPPGCRRSIFLGGCFSNFAIIESAITPNIPCVKLKISNCSYPDVKVLNECQSPLIIGDEVVEGLHQSCYFEIQTYQITSKNGTEFDIVKTLPLSRDQARFPGGLNNNINLAIQIGENTYNGFIESENQRLFIENNFYPNAIENCLRINSSIIENNCDKTVFINGVKLDPGKKVCKDNVPGELLLESYESAPLEDLSVEKSFIYQDKEYTIKYIVTKEQCNTGKSKTNVDF